MKRLMVLTLFAALLVFGCIDGGEEVTPTIVPDGSSSEEMTAPLEPPSEAPLETDFEALDYLSLVASGKSGECNFNITDQYPFLGTTRVWFADGKTRAETEVIRSDGTYESGPTLAISKDGKLYSNHPQLSNDVSDFYGDDRRYGDCDWAVIADEGKIYGQELLESGRAQVECRVVEVPASKFETPGNICTEDELNEALK